MFLNVLVLGKASVAVAGNLSMRWGVHTRVLVQHERKKSGYFSTVWRRIWSQKLTGSSTWNAGPGQQIATFASPSAANSLGLHLLKV